MPSTDHSVITNDSRHDAAFFDRNNVNLQNISQLQQQQQQQHLQMEEMAMQPRLRTSRDSTTVEPNAVDDSDGLNGTLIRGWDGWMHGHWAYYLAKKERRGCDKIDF